MTEPVTLAPTVSAIIVAAGKGARMNASRAKQYLHLGDEPILVHTLRRFIGCPLIERMVLAAPPEDTAFCRQIMEGLKTSKPYQIVPGGKTRQESVYQALLSLEEAGGVVAIHDGVRPFVRPEEIEACVTIAAREGACILAMEAYETVKRIVENSGTIRETLPRNAIRLAQTPQAFQYRLIRDAHEHALKNGFFGTDDAMLLEAMGHPVRVVPGSRFNIKITTPEDLQLGEALLKLL